MKEAGFRRPRFRSRTDGPRKQHRDGRAGARRVSSAPEAANAVDEAAVGGVPGHGCSAIAVAVSQLRREAIRLGMGTGMCLTDAGRVGRDGGESSGQLTLLGW